MWVRGPQSSSRTALSQRLLCEGLPTWHADDEAAGAELSPTLELYRRVLDPMLRGIGRAPIVTADAVPAEVEALCTYVAAGEGDRGVVRVWCGRES